MALISFATKGIHGVIQWKFQWKNYELVFQEAYLNIFFNSVLMAFITAATCLVLAFFISWGVATTSKQQRRIWLVLLMLPFFTNMIIRVYAIKLFVGIDGPLQWALQFLRIDFDPFVFTANPVLVFYGLTTTYLPFAVFPLYAAFEKFDFDLIESAKDMGANTVQLIFKVMIPNLKTALASAFGLVFIPSLGEYVIPDLLGGAKQMMLGGLIVENFLKSRNWPLGAAVSVWIFFCLIVFSLGAYLINRTKHERS